MTMAGRCSCCTSRCTCNRRNDPSTMELRLGARLAGYLCDLRVSAVRQVPAYSPSLPLAPRGSPHVLAREWHGAAVLVSQPALVTPRVAAFTVRTTSPLGRVRLLTRSLERPVNTGHTGAATFLRSHQWTTPTAVVAVLRCGTATAPEGSSVSDAWAQVTGFCQSDGDHSSMDLSFRICRRNAFRSPSSRHEQSRTHSPRYEDHRVDCQR